MTVHESVLGTSLVQYFDRLEPIGIVLLERGRGISGFDD
ncbi:hypothetical protein Natpe_0845 [Natrinema pellirubrum DSM 15624]|uniref:Uncharacterized protein n=1 Tax=Natrinema pellirubrum (strain DSM 15624 / CIP 106293 / JCM 10476 / NCIMB 786 / 157) TaxID=797303 RepID=L0JJK2_NATP1|nr:hypothetical protein Natpe_0845 [Natrinema pellirubrum DSM 15624]